ncbi:hypothetical protein NUW54_g6119 [Trametes sanguinea]|uniref:Uncharacterized protein n=1 Tax=Trametes sanguinea TaxID=158606 RepID=A0ACC1PVQ1_9APHY|nr:hypothetical protein NUW54_g6119 [Trametes sanguinea]
MVHFTSALLVAASAIAMHAQGAPHLPPRVVALPLPLDTHRLDGGGVAAVIADVVEGSETSSAPLHCRFGTIASATDGLPDIAQSMHSRNYWAHVAGREIVYGKVRVT